MDASEFFVAGGTLRAQAPSYVTRAADGTFLASLLAGEFCYVLTPRQMGKSSLMVRTAQELRARGIRTVIVDLTSIGTAASDEWYLGLLSRIRSGLRLEADVQQWWSRQEISAAQRLIAFIRDEVLAATEEHVVIFIDEIDSTLNLGFRDDFFAALRAMYNARAHEPIYQRITFALLGVATPTELIQDRERTPFNIGHRIDLREFSLTDAQPLVAGLDFAYPDQGAAILARIFYWSAGHPYLTQRLCLLAVQARIARWDDAAVDTLVAQTFLSDEGRKDPNLTFIQDRILGSPPDERRAMLKLYAQVYTGKRIVDDDRSLTQNRLELYGLVHVREKTVQIRNEIYRQVFDGGWIKAATPSDPQQRVALYAVLFALLVVGAVAAFFATRPNPTCATFVERFAASADSMVRLNALASLFGQQLNCRQDALRLFYGMDKDAQERLFLGIEDPRAAADDLEIVVRNVYVTLDTLAGDHDQVLLDEMRLALELSGKTEDDDLVREISAWLAGRKARRANLETEAVAALSTAIALNQDHPVTHYDRALAYVELGAYVPALQDLDDTVRIAQAAPPTPTPVPTATPTPFASAAPAAAPAAFDTPALPSGAGDFLTSTMTSTMTSTVTAGANANVTATTTFAGTVYSLRFLGPDDILNTVRQTIQGRPELYRQFSVSGTVYVHLAAADIPPPATATPALPRGPIVSVEAVVALNGGVPAALRIEAQANDPAVGTRNGDGIESVYFEILDADNNLVYENDQLNPGYCAFGGDSTCETAITTEDFPSGTYRVTATAVSASGLEASATASFALDWGAEPPVASPSPRPTATAEQATAAAPTPTRISALFPTLAAVLTQEPIFGAPARVNCDKVIERFSSLIEPANPCLFQGMGTACYVSGTVDAVLIDETLPFSQPGDTIPLDAIRRLTTRSPDGAVILNGGSNLNPVRIFAVSYSPESSFVITLRRADGETTSCAHARSGMVLQTPSGAQGTIVINGVTIRLN